MKHISLSHLFFLILSLVCSIFVPFNILLVLIDDMQEKQHTTLNFQYMKKKRNPFAHFDEKNLRLFILDKYFHSSQFEQNDEMHFDAIGLGRRFHSLTMIKSSEASQMPYIFYGYLFGVMNEKGICVVKAVNDCSVYHV